MRRLQLDAYYTHFTAEFPRFHRSRCVALELRESEIASHPSPGGRRTRARLHAVAGKRGVEVGFYEAKSHEVVAVGTCIALHPALDRARASLAALFADARGEGEIEIALGAVLADDDARKPVLDIEWRNGDLPAVFFARVDVAVKSGALQGARILVGESKLPATIGDPTPWIRGADDKPLKLAPGGFAQASEEGNLSLAKRVAEIARACARKKTERPRDGRALCRRRKFHGAARASRKVIAVESNAAACAAAQENLRTRSLEARVVVADAAGYEIPGKTPLVVLDPPRTRRA